MGKWLALVSAPQRKETATGAKDPRKHQRGGSKAMQAKAERKSQLKASGKPKHDDSEEPQRDHLTRGLVSSMFVEGGAVSTRTLSDSLDTLLPVRGVSLHTDMDA